MSKAHPDPPKRPSTLEKGESMPEWFVEAEEAEKSGATQPVPPEETQAGKPAEGIEAEKNDATQPLEPVEGARDESAGPVEAEDESSGVVEAEEEIEGLREALSELTGEAGQEESPVASLDASGPPSGQEVASQVEAEVAQWRKKAEENREKWMRAMAELENFRKRSRREIESSINFANANLLRELLDVLDDFERAQDAANHDEEEPKEAYREGIRLIYQRFVEVLRKSGLERIPAKGEVFDPNLHEAISQIETDEVESGRIAHVVQQGYRLKEMVLRPAKVVVAK